MSVTRRRFLQSSFAATVTLANLPRLLGAQVDLAWHDVTQGGVEGRGWTDQQRQRYFDRLPAKADGEGATDGSHPNDLGFMRNADAYETVLRTILG